jgi:hypothetical protein
MNYSITLLAAFLRVALIPLLSSALCYRMQQALLYVRNYRYFEVELGPENSKEYTNFALQADILYTEY